MNKKIITVAICALIGIIFLGTLGIVLSGKTTGTSGTEGTQGTEVFGTEVFETEIEEMETEIIEEVVTLLPVKMSASSIEKDLKIKLLDDNNNRIKGQDFVITVISQKTGTAKDYNDHDKDGIIYMKSLEPGDYVVQLHELEGFVIAQNTISVKVKDKIVYEKVEIKNEIKDESEIDVSKEDTSNKDVVVEEVLQDTLPLLESDIVTSEVEKSHVDFSNFPASYVIEEAGAVLPKEAVLFMHGNDASKSITLLLNIGDAAGMIKDISWRLVVEGASAPEAVLKMTVAEDKTSATLSVQETETAECKAKVEVELIFEDVTNNQVLACDVTVCEPTDDSILLKDVAGNQLYMDEDAKAVATVKDFAQAEKFYANPQYIGWQTFDGKLYYYKEDYTYATGKQVIGGVIYEFDETGYLIEKAETIGIDVSKWNGDIDWKAVAGAGIDYAIIRCGYRGTSTGALVEDPYFKQNIEGAIANGIKVGVYFYSQAISEVEAVEEASMALELVKGYHLQFPIFIDTEESGGRGDKITVEQRTNVIKAFCETVKNAGYKPGVYSGKWWYLNKINAGEIEKYHIWVAQYNTECNYSGRYDIWQYTDGGKVPGIKGKVDMNICYRTYF